MTAISVHIGSVSGFSADGVAYRAFGHLIGVRPGEVLLVPVSLAAGDLRRAEEYCPLPWHEVWDLIDAPEQQPAAMAPEDMAARFPALAMITPYGWVRDRIEYLLSPSIQRLTNACGIRYARAATREN